MDNRYSDVETYKRYVAYCKSVNVSPLEFERWNKQRGAIAVASGSDSARINSASGRNYFGVTG